MGKVKRGASTIELTHTVETVLAQLTIMYEVLEHTQSDPFLDNPSRHTAIDSLEKMGVMCQQTAQDFRGADEWR
jgi:5,10-methenyltetrahydromethanopterin hydrogenase